MTQQSWLDEEPKKPKIEKKMNVPSLKWDLEEKPHLEFAQAWRQTNEGLQEYLTMYGNYKSYLEYALSDVQAQAKLLADQFDEAMSVTMYKFVKQNTDAKRMVKEQVKGAVIDANPSLKDHAHQLREAQAEVLRLEGLLASYTTAFNTISRIISLRVTK